MTICMLKGKGLPHCFWGEAVTTATYVLNRYPTKRLKFVTPEEAWSGDKPMVHHFKIFGSVCYRHILDEKSKKLNDKSETLILVGYHPTGAYKLYSPVKQQVLINRDVIVDEVGSWNWVNETQTHVPYFLEESVKIPRNNTIEVSAVKRSESDFLLLDLWIMNSSVIVLFLVVENWCIWLFLLILNQ